MSKNGVKAKTDKLVKLCLTGLLGVAMLGTSVGSLHANAQEIGNGTGKYVSDYTSLEEAQKAAADLGVDLGEEGSVLLKNNGSLPLNGNEWVSVLGVSSDNVEGGSTTVADSLNDAGFRVNKELVNYYSKVGTVYGSENVAGLKGGTAESSMEIYNDVAVVIFSRTGGESNDCATVTDEVEDNKYGSENMGWKHNALYTENKGESNEKEYKHYLQLTDSEEELLEFAKEKCKKVVVVINSSNVMELGNIQNDPEIDGIVWVGRPGADGLRALGKILNGTVNPSGKTVDIYPKDLTADPTWFGYGKGEQFADNPDTYFRQQKGDGSVIYERDNPNMLAAIPGVSTGYSVVEYSEDIYMGYRYYETAHAEASKTPTNYEGFDYDDAVVYPFGYGLSYTSFTWENVTDSSTLTNWQNQKTLKLQVKVTNNGAYAGKDVVEVYAHAPYYTGKIAKSEVVLVGFAKTSLLQPGKSEIVTVEVNVQDMASFDYKDLNGNGKKTYELDEGEYELRFQTDSHNEKATQTLTELTEVKVLETDDYSGSTVEALFSGNDVYNTLGWDPAANDGKGATLVDEGKMTLLSRDNFAGTFPEPMTEEDLIRSDDWFYWHESFDQYNAEGNSYTQSIYEEHNGSVVYKDTEGGKYTLVTEGTGVSAKKVFVDTTDATKKYDYVEKKEGPQGPDQKLVIYVNKNGTELKVEKSVSETVKHDAVYQEDETLTDDARSANPVWTKYPEEFATGGEYASWTQANSHTADYSDVTIKVQAMVGIDMNGTTPLTKEDTSVSAFIGKTGKEAWDIFMNQLTWDELVTMTSNAGWGTPALDSIDKAGTSDNDGPNNLSGMYNWGDECHIASTWNVDLAYKEGVIMGNMAMQKGTTWYGPAMNTHRSAFGGRCNEYYSQDGYHGGAIGAAVIRGAQSKGVICYVKHCALNDQEIYRMNLMTIVSEQAARELYCKQFQMAVQEGGVVGLMTTYGSVGEISGATNYNFMTKLVREEWGFDGYAVTDAWMPCKDYWPLDMLVRAGCDAPLHNAGARKNGESYLLSGTWDTTNKVVKISDGNGGTKTSYTQWYYVRTCAERIIYTQANMNVLKNSYDLSGFVGKTLPAGTQGVVYGSKEKISTSYVQGNFGGNQSSKVKYEPAGIKVEGADNVVFKVVSGSLPAGLSMDVSGDITGTPSVAGDYTFTVRLVADNWITQDATFTMHVDSAFNIDWNKSATLGESVSGYIEPAEVNGKPVFNADDYDTVTYTVVSGRLPEGMSIDGNNIAGTPTEKGTFNFTVKIEGTKTSQGFMGPTTSKTTYECAFTFTVAGGNTTPGTGEQGPKGDAGDSAYDIAVKNGFTRTESEWLASLKGETGAKGADGKDGANGSGCGSAVGTVETAVLCGAVLLGVAGMVALKKKKN